MFKLISIIGLFFTGLFNAAKKAYKQSNPAVQAALKDASGIVAAINDNVNAAPPFVIEVIKKLFPTLPIDKLPALLQAAGKDIGIASDLLATDDLEVLIAHIQTMLNAKADESGIAWAKASHTAYLAIAVLLAPVGTKLAAIISLAEYVYHDLIKGK